MKTLKDLVNINSSTSQDEIVEFIKNKLKGKVKEIKIIKNTINNKTSILVGVNTPLKNTEPVILSAHIDTVIPSIKEYRTDPFVAVEANGKLYGLGTIDMKSFTAIVIDNINYIKSQPYPIVLAITTDEETTLCCIENVIENLNILNIKPKLSIIGEPTNSRFKLKSKGCYEYTLELFGKTCHSSIPQNGINAICAVSKIINFIEETQANFNLTSNCGIITGGDATNKVPDKATLKFDIRSFDETAVDLFIEKIEIKLEEIKNKYSGLEYKLQNTLKIPAFYMKNMQKLQNLISIQENEDVTFSGGCEAGYYTSYSGDAMIFGVGDLALAHKPNEFVEINEYKNYTNKLLNILQKINFVYY